MLTFRISMWGIKKLRMSSSSRNPIWIVQNQRTAWMKKEGCTVWTMREDGFLVTSDATINCICTFPIIDFNQLTGCVLTNFQISISSLLHHAEAAIKKRGFNDLRCNNFATNVFLDFGILLCLRSKTTFWVYSVSRMLGRAV